MEATDEQLKKLKLIEMDMLCVFIDVCQKLNLRYYLLGGTLLGAVRHKGFIPWDDDIDVGMPRGDYEIFLEKAQSLLPAYLFLQSLHSEPAYPMCFAKLRNNETTFIESSIHHMKINHGVYIDIFPLDYYPDNEQKQLQFNRKNADYIRRISMTFHTAERKALKTHLKSLLIKLRYPSLEKTVRKREALYRSVPPSTKLANYGGAWGEKEIMPADWYGEGTTLIFEGLEVSAPAKYHEWLTQVYGDYMQLPPEEKRVGHHYVDVIDLHKPYTEYLRIS